MLSKALLVALSLVSSKSHYLLVFAHQDAPYGQRADPHTAHSFATWVEVEDNTVVEKFTISWTGIHGVRFLKGPQPSRLLTLDASLARAKLRCLPVTMWGPFRITCAGFERAKQMHDRLALGEQTGQVQYNVLDWRTRSERNPQAINCIHVLTDIACLGTRTGRRYGIPASEFIIDQYRRCGIIVCEDPSAEWVWEALRGDFVVRRRALRGEDFFVDRTMLVEQSDAEPADEAPLSPVSIEESP